MAQDELVKQLDARLKYLEQRSDKYRAVHRQIRDVIAPDRGFFPKDGDDEDGLKERYAKLIDPTAHEGALTLASGMQSGLTNKNRPWFELSLEDKELAEWKPAALWLEECTNRIRMAMLRTNFYQATFSAYQDLCTFATHAQILDESAEGLINHRILPVGTYVLAEGPDGTVDTLFRRINMRAGNVKRRWGSKCSKELTKLAEEASTEDKVMKLVHAIYPREDTALDSGFAGEMQAASIYYEEDALTSLEKGGFFEMPLVAPRWNTNDQNVWGEGPANFVLGQTRMLQAMQRASLKQIQLVGDPPVVAPAHMKGRVKMIPAGVTYAQGMNTDTIKPLYEVKPDIQALEAKIQFIQNQIKRGFFNDFFLMLVAQPNMTATEVRERSSEKLILLGPVIDRTQVEFLDKAVHRYFAVMMRNGHLPEPPEEVANANYVVQYVSLLAQAQQISDVDNITGYAAYAGQLAQVDKQVLDVIDLDENLRDYGKRRNVPEGETRSKEEVEEIRQQRAQAQQQQEQVMRTEMIERMAKAGAGAAKAAKDLSDADLDGNSALAAMLGSGQGGAEGAGGTIQ